MASRRRPTPGDLQGAGPGLIEGRLRFTWCLGRAEAHPIQLLLTLAQLDGISEQSDQRLDERVPAARITSVLNSGLLWPAPAILDMVTSLRARFSAS